MRDYLLKRLFLFPITLFAIILVNFVILNLAPLDPVSGMNRSSLDEASRSSDGEMVGEEQFLLFREHYGLTRPILFNTWPSIKTKKIEEGLTELIEKKESSASEYHKLFTLWGDRAPFLMAPLINIGENEILPLPLRKMAINFFIRGGTRQGFVGPTLSEEKKEINKLIHENNSFLLSLKVKSSDKEEEINEKLKNLKDWYANNLDLYPSSYNFTDKLKIFFFETRFFKYFSKILLLDFGTIRNDANKLVVSEVLKRIKYSLTLSVTPMILTFGLASFFGMVMALRQNRTLDISLNTFFLILFSIPIFVAAPFLLEKVALQHKLPLSLPLGGFHSEETIYETFTSITRLKDTFIHLILPLTCIMYGMVAIQARLSRASVLQVLKEDYVKTAHAKGLYYRNVLFRHVGKNAAIPLVTSLASSLGLILAGSLMVEIVFEINGFGRFFYDAVVNRDYNVVLFSAIFGSCLTLLGYLIADICYTLLDPRIRFEP